MHAYTFFFIVERKKEEKKRQSSHLWWFLSCQHFVVWSHWQGDMMPYFTLWISEDSWNRCVKGVLLHCSLLWSYYAYLLCYIDFVWFVKMYRTLSIVEKCLMPTDFSRFSLDQSLYDVASFPSCSSLLSSGVKWDESHYGSISWPVWFCDCAMHN